MTNRLIAVIAFLLATALLVGAFVMAVDADSDLRDAVMLTVIAQPILLIGIAAAYDRSGGSSDG